MSQCGWIRSTLLTCLLLLTAGQAAAQSAESPDLYSASDYGGVGLLNMRTARFAPDGQFDIGVSFIEPYRRYYMSWQILPWAEITFRYTDVTNIKVGRRPTEQSESQFFKDIINFRSLGGSYLDRAFDFKFKIWDEGEIRPAFAIGLQDTIGTGLVSGEYMVFTKRVADFDITAGMGWGYFASRRHLSNPLRLLSNRFDERSADTGEGGKFGFGNFFSGRKVALFGGVEYFTPFRSLSLKLEYNSADPAEEPLNNPQAESLPINLGINYRPYDWFDLGLGFERGNSLMVRLSFRQNFHEEGLPNIMDPPPPPVKPRPQRTAAGDQHGTPKKYAHLAPKKSWLDFAVDSGAHARRDPTPAYIAQQDYKMKFLGNSAQNRRQWEREDFNPSMLVALFGEGGLSRAPLSDPVVGRPATHEKAVEPAPAPGLPNLAAGDSVQVSVSPKAPVEKAALASIQAHPDRQGRAGMTSGAVDGGREQLAEQVFSALGAAGFPVEAMEIGELTATVYFAKTRFRPFSKNLGRISRVLANELPPEIEAFTIVYVGKGLETSRVTVLRKDIENAVLARGSPEEIWANATVEDTRLSQRHSEDVISNDIYPLLSWSLRPELRQHIGDPDLGIWAADLRLSLAGRVKLRRNLWVSAAVSKFVFGNLDEIRRGPGSRLPHVRSDVREYVQQGRNSLDQLQVAYLFRPGRNLYGRVSAGIFETMYGGVDGELLYYPRGSDLALGLQLNWVKKRDFDQDLGFQDYDVVTGHLSVYYNLPFYNMDFAAHIGRYLAKDRGVTFDLSRQFDSGVRVGGFFTLTNVSAEEFGEGSFDKGFYMTIPLQRFLLRSSTRSMAFLFRPLARDGGQRVAVGPSLYGVVRGDQDDRIRDSWNEFMD